MAIGIIHNQFLLKTVQLVANSEGSDQEPRSTTNAPQAHNVETTLIQCQDAESTLFRLVCPMGSCPNTKED